MSGIKTIVCGCGKETDDWHGYPDDVLSCNKCHIKDKMHYINAQILRKKDEHRRVNIEIDSYEHDLNALEAELERILASEDAEE
ncbi:MAG: hypothetical protein KAJ03_01810 [Gammaproteobacteria bacterium]|nr:hypothetical protein [Gammaproteobacteria bacterium]